MIGLVGHSGSGKSTIINLLLRFYDPDSGIVFLIDGVDLRDISPASYPSQIGVVLQEIFLFSGSIFENVIYSKPTLPMKKWSALVNGKCSRFYYEVLWWLRYADRSERTDAFRWRKAADRNRKEQWSMIPESLILDEATASLDTESEKLVQEALRRLVQNRTTFAIAHRLSTLKFADRLIVLDHGKICRVWDARWITLKAKGIYYGLVLTQLKHTRLVGQGRNTQKKNISAPNNKSYRLPKETGMRYNILCYGRFQNHMIS